MIQKEFVFVQMYFYESEAQERTMMNDFNEIAEIYAPVNVINEHGVFAPKNTATSARTSVRTQQYNILPNTTAPISGMYRINTVIVPYDSTKEDEVRKINLMIRRLGYTAEWFIMGDAEDMEKDYNTIPTTLKAGIYPYQLWMWVKYIQEKRQLLASLTDNTDRNKVKRAIETAVQNIKEIYVDPIYPGCVEEIIQFAKNTPERNYAKSQQEFHDHFRACYKDFMLQVYIAINAEGLGRTSDQIKTMVREMYNKLGILGGDLDNIIREQRTEKATLRHPLPTRIDDPLMPGYRPENNLFFGHMEGNGNASNGTYTALGGSKRKTRRRTTKRTRHMRKSRRHH